MCWTGALDIADSPPEIYNYWSFVQCRLGSVYAFLTHYHLKYNTFGNHFKKQLSSISSGHGKSVFEQQMSSVKYWGKQGEKPEAVFGMGMLIEQLLTDWPVSLVGYFVFHPSVIYSISSVESALIERLKFIFSSVFPNFVNVHVTQTRFAEEW